MSKLTREEFKAYLKQIRELAEGPLEEIQKEVEKTIRWKCQICGYEHEGEELPEDFKCPWCGQPATAFCKVD